MSFDSSASHDKLPTLVAHEGDEEMLNQCFLTISLLLTSDTLELWARGPGGLSLHHDYKSNSSGSNTIKHIYTSDHSKNLCEMAMASLTGFYSKEIRSTKPDVPQPQTLVAFRLPRANVNTDVFVVGYASKYIKVTS